MKHHKQRLENDLAAIRYEIKDIRDRIQEVVKNAVRALLTADKRLPD